jgi:hypothetical protein
VEASHPPENFPGCGNTPPMPQSNGNAPCINGVDYGRSAKGTPLGQNPTPVGVNALHDLLGVHTYFARQPIVDTAAAAGLRQLSIQTPPQLSVPLHQRQRGRRGGLGR